MSHIAAQVNTARAGRQGFTPNSAHHPDLIQIISMKTINLNVEDKPSLTKDTLGIRTELPCILDLLSNLPE